jgi:hypothetical protein
MKDSISQLRLRAQILRKERAIGIFPGGDSMVDVHPKVTVDLNYTVRRPHGLVRFVIQ